MFEVPDRVDLLFGVEPAKCAQCEKENLGSWSFSTAVEVSGPCGDLGEVQRVELAESPEGASFWLPDVAAFDLGEVRVRDAGSALDIAQAPVAVTARAAEDVPDLWLAGLGGIGLASFAAWRRWLHNLCVPKTSSTSCDQAIFVDRATGVSLSSDVAPLKIDRSG
ncbi:MAG TPA: hypothetical protein VF933_07780 [Streptosporangiaceae bacterium]